MSVRINGDNTTAAPGITRGDDTDTGVQFGTNEVSLVTGGSERVKVDSSGRLLLGTATEGYTDYADNLTIADSGDCGLTIRSGTSSQGNIYFSDGTSGSDEYEGIIQYLHNVDAMAFGVNNGSEKLRILSGGGLTFNGDTAAANALDDYEEGTWTPTLPNGGTASLHSARYTKIGSHVFAYLYISVSSTPNNGNEFRIGGLPFTCDSGSYYPGGVVSYTSSYNLGGYRPLVFSGSTFIYHHTISGSQPSLLNSGVTGLGEYVATIAYEAA